MVEALAGELRRRCTSATRSTRRRRWGRSPRQRQRDRVEGYIAKGVDEGATLATGGGRPKHLDRGWFVEPTVFGNVDNSSTIAQEEIFGPVLSVIPAADERDAVRIANDTIYGLNSSVFTPDADRAPRGRARSCGPAPSGTTRSAPTSASRSAGSSSRASAARAAREGLRALPRDQDRHPRRALRRLPGRLTDAEPERPLGNSTRLRRGREAAAMAQVDVERDGAVMLLTLNRPQRKNAMTLTMFALLADAWAELSADDDLRCAILTGAEGNFSSGMDLRAMAGDVDPDGAIDEQARLRDDPGFIYRGLLKTYRPTKPVIAAVEGVAIAGGTEILQGTDIRVAGESARFGVSEARWSLYPMGGSAVRLQRQIPYTVAADILLTGKHLLAPEAKEIGLIGHVVPDGQALVEGEGDRGDGRRQWPARGGGHPQDAARDPAHERGRRVRARGRLHGGDHGVERRQGRPPRVRREAHPQLHAHVAGRGRRASDHLVPAGEDVRLAIGVERASREVPGPHPPPPGPLAERDTRPRRARRRGHHLHALERLQNPAR